MSYKDPEKQREYWRNKKKRQRENPVFRAKDNKRITLYKKRMQVHKIEIVASFRNKGCCFCSEKEHCCLDAHHVDSSQKTDNIADLVSGSASISKLQRELEKCICVCKNCHAKLHAGLLEVPSVGCGGSLPCLISRS